MEVSFRKLRIVKFKGRSFEYVEDEVAVEHPITIHINGKLLDVLYATPQELIELTVGYLMTKGLIKNLGEIIEIRTRNSSIYITVLESVEQRVKKHSIEHTKTLKTAFDQTHNWKVESEVKWPHTKILETVEKLNTKATIFRRTGGTHAAMITSIEGIEILCEDVGRHNAVDKVIGAYALRGFKDFSRVLLTFSGRVSSEIVLKAAEVKIPIIASISAPTSLGITLAEQSGITLIGFVRESGFNVYTHPERVT